LGLITAPPRVQAFVSHGRSPANHGATTRHQAQDQTTKESQNAQPTVGARAEQQCARLPAERRCATTLLLQITAFSFHFNPISQKIDRHLHFFI